MWELEQHQHQNKMVDKTITTMNTVFNSSNSAAKSLSIYPGLRKGSKENVAQGSSCMLGVNALFLEMDSGSIIGFMVTVFFKITRFCLHCENTIFPSFGDEVAHS